ncbi:vacuolar protein sorting-associated protein 27 [Coprinopsis sp. MPI-PUGE-AT-0042]|nr:vacuolar protein sorting-associated protein 27 [Coprinopsis sp. MPI-PUGE-AT-0042]
MSGLGAWIWGTSQLDDAIDKATSELLPAGSEDIALNLEICDQIRSKSAPAKDAMKALKRRLNHKNPNVQLLALSLTDICVKNAGDLFLNEIASREFMDNLVSILKIPALNHDVKNTMLRFIQNWSIAFEAKPQLAYVGTVYKQLQNEGFKFPPKDLAIANSAMIDTQTAPEWIDSDVCLRCRTAFTFTNRKHHCRNCGQVFDQACSSKTMPLPHYGIAQEVRVCDGCYSKITKKGERSSSKKEPRSPSSKTKHSTKHRTSGQDMEDAELQRAIQLSLQESSSSRTGYVPSSNQWQVSEPPLVERNTYPRDNPRVEEEEDPELRAAIEASLREASAPRASAPLETPRIEEPSYPNIPRLPNHDLDPMESDTVLTFNQTVEQVESQGGRDLSQFPAVTAMYDKANNLRPKMALSLDDTTRKHEVLSEMHSKLSEAVKLYDQILTQQVSQPRYRSSVASPSYQPASSAYHTPGYAPQQQYVPQQHTGTYAASPSTQQPQYAQSPYAPSAPQPTSQYAPSAPQFSSVSPAPAHHTLPPVTYGTHLVSVASPPPAPTSLPQSPPPMQPNYASAPPQHIHPQPSAPPPPPPQQRGAQLARSHTTASAPQYHPQQQAHPHQHQQQQQQRAQYQQQQQQYQQEQARQNLISSAPAPPTSLPYFPAAPTSVPQTQFEQQEERKEAMLIDL